jgi:hypothetical protein
VVSLFEAARRLDKQPVVQPTPGRTPLPVALAPGDIIELKASREKESFIGPINLEIRGGGKLSYI